MSQESPSAAEESRFAPFVGRSAPAAHYDVERGHVRRFIEAIGGAAPEISDGERVAAPPTFAAVLRAPDPRDGLPIDWTRLLHGEQEIRYQRPLYVGDRVRVVATIAAAGVKASKSGLMDTLTVETVGSDESGAPIFTSRSTVLVRR